MSRTFMVRYHTYRSLHVCTLPPRSVLSLHCAEVSRCEPPWRDLQGKDGAVVVRVVSVVVAVVVAVAVADATDPDLAEGVVVAYMHNVDQNQVRRRRRQDHLHRDRPVRNSFELAWSRT